MPKTVDGVVAAALSPYCNVRNQGGCVMPVATVTSKGQVTIPKEIRDRLKLKQGARIRFTENADGTVTLRAQTRSVLDLVGVLKPKPARHVSVEEMNEAVRRAAARSRPER